MATQARFYHAGCPVCISAEETFVRALDPANYEVKVIHLGEKSKELAAAEVAGVESVPALVIDEQVFHINFGAKLSDLR